MSTKTLAAADETANVTADKRLAGKAERDGPCLVQLAMQRGEQSVQHLAAPLF